MGIGKYWGYRQNIGDIALIGDISSIHGKIWPYPQYRCRQLKIPIYRQIYRCIGRYFNPW
ncbi:unnamed protein product [Prunus brigantina]